jgi:hypothetical protein
MKRGVQVHNMSKHSLIMHQINSTAKWSAIKLFPDMGLIPGEKHLAHTSMCPACPTTMLLLIESLSPLQTKQKSLFFPQATCIIQDG